MNERIRANPATHTHTHTHTHTKKKKIIKKKMQYELEESSMLG